MGYRIPDAQVRSNNEVNGFWYEADEGKAHERVIPLVGRLIASDSTRRANVMRLLRMAGNYTHTGLGASQEMDPNRLRYNLIAQGVATLKAEITQNEPKASYQAVAADGGASDWTIKQAAKQCELLTESQMRAAKWWSEIAPQCLVDALKTGTGLAYSYVDILRADVCTERCHPLEVVVDDADAHYGKPRMIFRRRLVDREVLARSFPGHEETIRDSKQVKRFTGTDDDQWMLRDAGEADLVLVVQAWLLPSVPGAGDGTYVVCTEGLDLWQDEYKHNTFPFTKIVYEEADTGWWGKSLAEELYPDQIELNRTLIKIQDSFAVAGGAWLVPRGAKVRLAHLTDMPGAIIEFNEGAGAPQYYAPQTVAGEMYAHADRIIGRALQRVGINEMATAGTKPAGLNSGEAIRSYRDQFSMRQNPLAKAYEAFCVSQAELLDMLNRELYERLSEQSDEERKEMPAVPVTVARGRRKVLKRLRWDEIDLPENRFVIGAFPTSSLPSYPAGRLATVTEWMEGGLVQPDQAKRLLNFPDLEGELKLDMVDYDFALFAFETMVEDGKYVAPEPYQNLQMALELMRRAYLRARIDEVPESRLTLVRNHMTALKRLIEKAAKPQSAPASAAPVAPPMAPDAALPAPDAAGPVESPPMDIAA